MNCEGLKLYFESKKFNNNDVDTLMFLYTKIQFVKLKDITSFNVINDKLTENDKKIINKIIEESNFINQARNKQKIYNKMKKQIIKLVYDNITQEKYYYPKTEKNKDVCLTYEKICEDHFYHISKQTVLEEIQSYFKKEED